MKVALAQINTKVGDFEGIVRKVCTYVGRAKSLGADLIAFPEMTTTGYPPRDLVELPSFVEANLKALQGIAQAARGIRVVVGYIDRNQQSGGKPLFNAAALCADGQVQQRYFKNLLPTYDVFDEGRYFEPGKQVGLWKVERVSEAKPDRIDSGRLGGANDGIAERQMGGLGGERLSPPMLIGISICEDAWNDKLFWEKRLYDRDPIEEEVQKGAQCLLNISASPFSMEKVQLRKNMLQALAIQYDLPLFYVNQVGGNDELVFDGSSLVLNRRGAIIAQGKNFEEELLLADPDQEPLGSHSEVDERELLCQALVVGIRDYLHKCGFKKLALGLSGGIDSALTAVLASRAVGPKNVLGLIMPSPYSSRESVEDAKALVKNLKIQCETIPITSVYRAYRTLFGRNRRPPDLADENLQARIRGNLLMLLSNRKGYLVLSTGNKSEVAVGYCTLYGDMSGGLAAISDLPKMLVYDLSRWINERRLLIPERIFTKAPSAELKPNQRDQDTLPPYEILDPILKAYVEEHKSEDEIVSQGFSRKTVRWVLRRVVQNEYKRRQAAPGIRVTSKAFGIGRRFPMARKV